MILIFGLFKHDLMFGQALMLMSTPVSSYYFFIKEHFYDEADGSGDNRYDGVVNLGLLTDSEANQIFQEAIRRLVFVINNDSESEFTIIRNEPRFLQVSESDFDKTGLHSYTEYVLRSENETDASTILEWKVKSESFFRSRYQDAQQQLDLTGFRKPTNDTILVAAVRAAELLREKPVNRPQCCSELVENALVPNASVEANRNQPVSEGICGRGSTANCSHESDVTDCAVESGSQIADAEITNIPFVIDKRYAEELLAKILALPAPPPGKKGDGHWAHCSEVAEKLNIAVSSLGRYRSQDSLASHVVKHGNPDAEDNDSRVVLAGVEKYGRAWRKLREGAQVYYYRPSVGLDKKTVDSDVACSDKTIDSLPSGS